MSPLLQLPLSVFTPIIAMTVLCQSQASSTDPLVSYTFAYTIAAWVQTFLVVCTILFVWIQTRHLKRGQNMQAFVSMQKSLHDFNAMPRGQSRKAMAILNLNHIYLIWGLRHNKLLDEETWLAEEEYIKWSLARFLDLKPLWGSTKKMYHKDFAGYIEQIFAVVSTQAQPVAAQPDFKMTPCTDAATYARSVSDLIQAVAEERVTLDEATRMAALYELQRHALHGGDAGAEAT